MANKGNAMESHANLDGYFRQNLPRAFFVVAKHGVEGLEEVGDGGHLGVALYARRRLGLHAYRGGVRDQGTHGITCTMLKELFMTSCTL